MVNNKWNWEERPERSAADEAIIIPYIAVFLGPNIAARIPPYSYQETSTLSSDLILQLEYHPIPTKKLVLSNPRKEMSCLKSKAICGNMEAILNQFIA